MRAVYLLFALLSLFSCMLPAGVFSMIWDPISTNMTVGVPSIAILRMLLAAGVVLAVILSDRIRSSALVRDLMIAATALEALALLGFSLSRVFWNLCAWSVCLGFGLGMGVCLLCRNVRMADGKYVEVVFAAGAAGAAAGVGILALVFRENGGWRTACQILAVVQVLLCLVQFSLRRSALLHSEEDLRILERSHNRTQSQRRHEKIDRDGDVDERYGSAYIRRLCCMYLASVLCFLLITAAVLWPQTYLVAAGLETIPGGLSVILVCAGLACGRLVSSLFRVPREVKGMAAAILAVLATGIGALMMRSGTSTQMLMVFQFLTGVCAGPVFPCLVSAQDERLDEEMQGSLLSLLSAFYFGSWALITPLAQALVGSSRESEFMLFMFADAVLMALCLVFSQKRVKR